MNYISKLSKVKKKKNIINYNVIFQPFLVGLIKEKKRNTTKQIIFIVLTVEIIMKV